MARLIERFESQPGEWAWRVTSHKDVKALLADERLYGPHVMRVHTAWRKTMNKVFSSTIFDGLVPFIRDVSAALLDEMISAGPPADVHEIYSTSLTAQVMCELLSVPPGDISLFREWAQEGDDNTPMPDGMGKLMSYAEQLMAERGDEPAEDAVSALLMARAGSEKAHALRSAKLLAGMLAFGWQTPAAMIDSGVELLLANPAQRQLLDEQPALISRAVEEVLRLTRAPLAVEGGVHRRAYTDVEVGDVTVRAGDKVLLDIVAANRDSEVFPDPERFDIRRDPNPQLTFGYAYYMCNFARLARSEIGIGLATLFGGIQGLRLEAQPDLPAAGTAGQGRQEDQLTVAW
jgi:cytochrome P450